MLNTRLRKNIDWPLIALPILVATLGIIAIYSANNYYARRQLVWLPIGCAAMAIVASIDYQVYRRFSRGLYLANLFLLIVVWKFGSGAKGAVRWIDLGPLSFQPSEFAKLFTILTLATFLTGRQEEIGKPGALFASFAHVAIPVALIFRQPDLGTALVLIACWFGMAYMAGAKTKHLLVYVIVGVALFAGMWRFDLIRDYQKERLRVFLNPEADAKGSGYHIIQSKIAIGSGRTAGKGLMSGTQVQGEFIPENHTDFIFTVVGEETGFVGSALIVLLYGGILLRGMMVVGSCEDLNGKLIGAGIVSMYAFHVIVNIGMTIQMMPVTGVPLPLFSYGGTSLLLNMAALGLLQSVAMRRSNLMF